MTTSRRPRVLGFAHRGGMADAPENSLEAFRKALAFGATGLESDVWIDAAGEPVLSHGSPARLAEPPLSLLALFEACGTDFDLSLDMKGPDAAEATLEVCREAGFDVTRLWLCGGAGSCARWRALDPDVRLVCDLRWREALFHPTAAVQRLRGTGIDAVNLRHGRWSARLVGVVHDAGLKAFAWDVNNRLGLRLALRRGVDGVYSDHVRLLAEVPSG